MGIKIGGRGKLEGVHKRTIGDVGIRKNWEKQKIEVGKDEWNRIIKKRIHKREEEEWKRRMKHRPKQRTYRKVKDKLEVEGYLSRKYV